MIEVQDLYGRLKKDENGWIINPIEDLSKIINIHPDITYLMRGVTVEGKIVTALEGKEVIYRMDGDFAIVQSITKRSLEEDLKNKFQELVKRSRDVSYTSVDNGSLSNEDKDLFTAIIGDEFPEFKERHGSLVNLMYRLMSEFTIKRKK